MAAGSTVGTAVSVSVANESSAAGDAVSRCSALQYVDFSGLQDAPTQITEAVGVDARGSVPAYCRVQGYVSPQVGFELQLPLAGWNGKFIELGCGGFCGALDEDSCRDPLRRGYACIVSDMGHRGEGGLWAYNNLQAKVDWGYRGAHVVALAGKALTQHYYAQGPRKSYFSGCSTGGRQAMVEAQRFPWDFDGIIAGAPPLNFTANSLAQLWASRALKDSNGRALLSSAELQHLHTAVLAHCDRDDGIQDGVLGNPSQCIFDPALLACKNGATEACLSDAQIAAVNKIYAGPPASSAVAASGYMRGSELGWEGLYFSADGGPGFLYRYTAQKFQYAAFFPDAGPAWTPADLNFESDFQRLGTLESLYSATNPDLRPFARHGGKLLMYHGWNDGLEPPAASVDYYETAERVMGGRAATQPFIRLFMIPGLNHCAGGEGAWAVDYLSDLENWVERGHAPDRLVGEHLIMAEDPAQAQGQMKELHFPVPATAVSFSRPLYPYPLRARYNGRGDPRRAASFAPVGEK